MDHSIHTMRLWTVTKAKELCSDWNMKTFFQVVHNDMAKCLEHLNDLRLPGELKAENIKLHWTMCRCTKSMFASHT